MCEKNIPDMQLIINEPDLIKRAVKATDLCATISDIIEELRTELRKSDYKMGELEENSEEYKIEEIKYNFLEKLLKNVNEIIEDNGVILNDLWN